MQIRIHNINDTSIAEVVSDDIIISTIEDGTNLLGDLYYQGFDKVIIHEKNIAPPFFDLKTRIAGEILQKFSNYKVKLAIIGDFKAYQSKSLHDFIYESNKMSLVNFLASTEEALKKL